MASAITKIMNGELPAYTVFQGGGFHAFLDIHPATRGHILVASEIPTELWTQLPTEEVALEGLLGAIIGRRQERLLPGVRRIVRATFGEQDPRFHSHHIPQYEDGDVIRRMHPDSSRMVEPVDYDSLAETQALLAFPADLTGYAVEGLETQRERLQAPGTILNGGAVVLPAEAIPADLLRQ